MYTIGVDLGGTNIAIGICDKEMNIIAKGSVKTEVSGGTAHIMDNMAGLINSLIKNNKINKSDIEYVGIATPGAVNVSEGIVESAFNLGFSHFPIAKELKSRIGIENIYVANDANAAALGEALTGAARGTKHSVMVTLGTGVGGGVIIDGHIFDRGVNAAVAELGHMVIEVGGRQCSCGRRGCFEAYSSATALTNMTSEKMNELKIKKIPSHLFTESEQFGKVTARTAFNALRMGNPFAKEIVDTYIRYLAEGITNIINIFQPEVLSIGGGVCNEGDALLIPLLEIIDREQYTRHNEHKTKITIAKLGNDAGIIGAAGLGR
jgi:glucokinase